LQVTAKYTPVNASRATEGFRSTREATNAGNDRNEDQALRTPEAAG
jgi:hypothetical protein